MKQFIRFNQEKRGNCPRDFGMNHFNLQYFMFRIVGFDSDSGAAIPGLMYDRSRRDRIHRSHRSHRY